MKKYAVQVPDYYSVKHYQEFDKFAHLDEEEQMLAMVSLLTENTIEDIREWPVQLIIKVYNELQSMLKSIDPEFYPVIEWKGQMYGFQPMHKMSVGEYIDLDNLCKNTKDNLNEILAILYRPITQNKLDTNKFVTKSVLRAYNGEVENAFTYYKIEKYDSDVRKQQAKLMGDFPATIALGALTFFLSSKVTLLNDSQISFPTWEEMQKVMRAEMKSKAKFRLANTMVGYLRSTNLAKHPSYQ